MTIYPSTRVLPYVYQLTHKTTGQFYIGYREANSTPSHLDLPKYRTSSKVISEIGFDNFEWIIVAEFFSGNDAYDHEQWMIKESFDNPLILNGQYRANGKARFKAVCRPHSDETKAKISAAGRGRKLSEEHKAILNAVHIGRLNSEETKIKMSIAHLNKPKTAAHKENLSSAKSMTWCVIRPDGIRETIINMKAFCISNGLDPTHMGRVAAGKAKHHKGYVCSKNIPKIGC